jgi:uncharacterized protein DUF1552
MIISKKALPRRTFLRGLGATVALPLLDAMVPALSATSKTAAKPLCRLGFVYVPNGTFQPQWNPTGSGTAFELSPILTPLAPFRDNVVVLNGLAQRQAESFGDGNADHHRGAAAWLSGVHAWTRTKGADVRLATTVDQIAARELGAETRVPSLELSLETPSSIACDSGADCFFSNTISWRTPTVPLPMETHPRVVFERLFGDGGSAADRRAHLQKTGSILDSLAQQVASLERRLGSHDRSKLTDYLEAVRAVEGRIQRAERDTTDADLPLPERPVGIPDSFDDHAKLMFDLQVLAFQTDATRVITMMLARELSNRSYPAIGVPDGHHSVSHHQHNPDLVSRKVKIDTYHVQLLAYFLEKLRATPDGDGTLLDHVMLLYGSGMGDGNLHDHTNLPLFLAGGAAGGLKGGRYLQYAETPMTNLLLSMLDKAGVRTDTLGDSTGRLDMDRLSEV